MEWLDYANGLMALIGAIVGLVSAAIPAGILIYNLFKGKKFNEVLAILKEMADAAIREAEKSGKSGADKKQMVIDIVKAGAASKGIDVEPFMNQLMSFIDLTVKEYNEFSKK